MLRVVADVGKIVGIEKSAVVGKFGQFVAVAEAAGLMADVAGESDRFAGRERLLECVNRVKIARRRADAMERRGRIANS